MMPLGAAVETSDVGQVIPQLGQVWAEFLTKMALSASGNVVERMKSCLEWSSSMLSGAIELLETIERQQ